MTHHDKLRSYSADELAKYLWKRLRLEELDPPIDHPLVMDSPEGLIIRALKESEDRSFRKRLINAVKKNVAELSIRSATQQLNAIANEQLASLAFLAAAIGSADLCTPLYQLASGFLIEPANKTAVSSRTLLHLLRAVARLQEGTYLVPFWKELWGHENPILREIAYYGLSRADTEQAMQMLQDVVGDRDIDLSAVAWHLATESPGTETLGREVATLPIEMRHEIRAALVDASAGDSTIKAVQDFDRYVALGEEKEKHVLIWLLRQPMDCWLQNYDIFCNLLQKFCDDQKKVNPFLTAWCSSEFRPLPRRLRSCSEKTMRGIVSHTMRGIETCTKYIGEEQSANQ